MNDIASLFEILAFTAMVAVPPILLHRLLAGAEGATLDDLFAIPLDAPWPRGVQEEEPVRWRLELLDRRPPAAMPADDGCRPPRLPQPAAARRDGDRLMPA